MMNKTLIFSPAVYNLAETTRALEIARACREHFDILFVSYGGEFEHLIHEAGYPVRHLTPTLTPEKIDYLYKVDQGKALGYFFTADEVREQVRNEIALFEEVQPAAVVTGFNFSNDISCRAAGVPLVWLIQSTWFFDELLDAELASYPDMLDVPPLRWLPDGALVWLSRRLFGLFNLMVRPYDRVAKEYGLPPIRTMGNLWSGDYNLLPEPDTFCDLPLPDNCVFVTPLIARLDAPVPDEILNMPHDLPIVYFAMGSSGQPEVIARIVEAFAGRPYRVIAPVKRHLEGLDVTIPSNVLVTDWLPAHKVNPLADISVIHGGVGTTMTAALAGTPVVGIAMQPEQEVNIDCLVRKGFAIRIRKTRLTPQRLMQAIDTLLADESAKAKARAFQQVMQQWEDPERITQFFVRTFLGQDAASPDKGVARHDQA